METLFEEYNNEEIKPLLRIGNLMVGKYHKKEGYKGFIPPILPENFLPEEYEKPKKKKGITNERQTIVKSFVDEINKERDVTKLKPVTGRQIGVKLGVLKTNEELYEFLSICKDYKNRHGSFGKRFWGGFKEKKSI